MLKMECGNCFYFAKEGEAGFCRRFPPVLVTHIILANDETTANNPVQILLPKVVYRDSFWPGVAPDRWCGEFKIKETIQ